MALNSLGNIGSAVSEALLRAYMLKFQQDWAQQQNQQSRDAEYQDWVRRQQFAQSQDAPARRYQAAQLRLGLFQNRPDADPEKQAALREMQDAASAYFGSEFRLPTATATVTTGQREIPGIPARTYQRTVSEPVSVPAVPGRTEPITEQRTILTMGGGATDPKTLQVLHQQKREEIATLGELVARGSRKPEELWRAVSEFNAYTRQLRQQAVQGGMSALESEAAFPSITQRAAENAIASRRQPPKLVAIVDSRGRVVNQIMAPAGTDVRMVSGEAGPKTVAIIDPRTGRVIRQLQVPAGTQVISAPAGGGQGSVGPPLPAGQVAGALDIRPIRNRQGSITAYQVNGQQFTIQQARAEAVRLQAENPQAAQQLASAIGYTLAAPKATKAEQQSAAVTSAVRSAVDDFVIVQSSPPADQNDQRAIANYQQALVQKANAVWKAVRGAMPSDPPPSAAVAWVWAQWATQGRAPLAPADLSNLGRPLTSVEFAWLRRQGVIRFGR